VPFHALQPRGSRIQVKGITATLLLWISNLLLWLFVALRWRKLKAVVRTVTALHAAKMDRYYKAWLFITSATYVWPVPCWGISDFSSRLVSSKSELFRFRSKVTFEACNINKQLCTEPTAFSLKVPSGLAVVTLISKTRKLRLVQNATTFVRVCLDTMLH